MKVGTRWAAAVALLAAVSSAGAMEVLRTDRLALDINGRGQMFGVGEFVPDAYRDNARVYLFMKQARVGINGRFDDIKFETQFAFGGENANGSNTDLGLLDFAADVPIKDDLIKPLNGTIFKIGQFRVPYGREGITDRGYMNFGERSIATMPVYQGRDYGLALHQAGLFTWTGGVFSAGGRDVPQRYIPETLGVPEVVLRAGYNDGIDEDVYHVKGTDLDLKKSGKAAYLNGFYMQDTLIGHNTVLGVRTIDKNLLINGNYNPYIGAGPNRTNGAATTFQRGNIFALGGDAVIRHKLSDDSSVEGEAELNWTGYHNRYGVLHHESARVQGGYRKGKAAINLRYAALLMDPNTNLRSGNKYFSPTMGSAIHEVTPSLTYFFKKHNLKVIADLPCYFNMPVYNEAGVGSYVFADMPDQVTVISTAGNTVTRRSIVEGRMLFQFAF